MPFAFLQSLTDERGGPHDSSTIARYGFALPYIKNKAVLDIGCGIGQGPYIFATHGARSVLAIDYAKIAIQYAKKHFHHRNITFKKIDATTISTIDNRFDVITSFELLEHLPLKSHKKFICDIAMLLNRNGILILSTPNRLVYSSGSKTSLNPYHKFEYVKKELNTLCSKQFQKTVIYGIKNTNERYFKHEESFGKTHRSKLVHAVSKFRLTHQLLSFIPQRLKNTFTGRDSARNQSRVSDYVIQKQNVDSAENLIAFCTK